MSIDWSVVAGVMIGAGIGLFVVGVLKLLDERYLRRKLLLTAIEAELRDRHVDAIDDELVKMRKAKGKR